MTCLGKIVGGGLPAAAYGGRADIMATVAPDGPVYQAGTLSGNPLAMAAGAALLDLLARPGTYEALEALQRAARGRACARAARDAGATVTINRVGSMITVFFCAGPVTDYATAKASDTKRFGRFFHAMLERGVYLPPGAVRGGLRLARPRRGRDRRDRRRRRRGLPRGRPERLTRPASSGASPRLPVEHLAVLALPLALPPRGRGRRSSRRA